MPTISDLTGSTVNAVRECSLGAPVVDILPYSRAGDARHELLFMLKPECTAASADSIARILLRIHDAFEEYRAGVSFLSAVSGRHLRKTQFVERLYSAMSNAASGSPRTVLDHVRHALSDHTSITPVDQKVVGALEILAEHPTLDARTLAALCDETVPSRVAAGVYFSPIEFAGCTYFVVNGFFPFQLQRFTDDSACIILAVIHSDSSWAVLRGSMLGSTSPERADAASLRGWLRDRSESLGLEPTSALRTGVHLSAGPIEAAAEVALALETSSLTGTVRAADTGIGSRLLALGVPRELLETLVTNPIARSIDEDRAVFDLTEAMDVEECATTVLEAFA